MAINVIKWAAALVDRGAVLTTQLNSLGDATLSAVGAEIDNSVNLDTFGILELNVAFGSAPVSTGIIEIYELVAPDGTNYGDGGASVNPGLLAYVAAIPLKSVTTAQRIHSHPIKLKPAKTKWLLFNRAGQAFPASGSTLKLFTANESVVT